MKRAISMLLLLPVASFAADTNALPALVPAYAEMPTTFWERHHLAVILSIVAALVIVTLVLVLLMRPKPPVVSTPATVAREALSKLQNRPEDGRMLSEASQILRRYLCAVFGISMGEMSTTEFSRVLAANQNVDTRFAQMIGAFLRACDQDKFAPNVIAPPLNAVKRVLEFIETVEAHRARPEGAPR